MLAAREGGHGTACPEAAAAAAFEHLTAEGVTAEAVNRAVEGLLTASRFRMLTPLPTLATDAAGGGGGEGEAAPADSPDTAR